MESVWSMLPTDILEVVSKKITSIEDYIRLRMVCMRWRSTLSPTPRYLPPQLPWFMLPYNPHSKEGNTDCLRSFYDISTGRTRRINLPETCGKRYCGSSRGWLVMEDGPEFSLLNPVTRVQIQLPSLKVLPTILRVSGLESEKIRSQLDIWPRRYNINMETNYPIMTRVVLTSSPLDPDCIVMALFKSNWRLAFCRIGDESWTLFEVPGPLTLILDATYHNGLFYCLFFDKVKVYDIKSTICEVSKINTPLQGVEYHLVEGEVDELLLVAQHHVPQSRKFSVYKLGIGEGKDQADWIKVSNIGERMYFVCQDIKQCFMFPTDNSQMPVLAPNLLCCAYSYIVPNNGEDHPEFFYIIKMAEPLEEVSIFSDDVTAVVKGFGSYPDVYSRALWITPSFY